MIMKRLATFFRGLSGKIGAGVTLAGLAFAPHANAAEIVSAPRVTGFFDTSSATRVRCEVEVSYEVREDTADQVNNAGAGEDRFSILLRNNSFRRIASENLEIVVGETDTGPTMCLDCARRSKQCINNHLWMRENKKFTSIFRKDDINICTRLDQT